MKNQDITKTALVLDGDDFMQKYGFNCPIGVRGRNSDNKIYKHHM